MYAVRSTSVACLKRKLQWHCTIHLFGERCQKHLIHCAIAFHLIFVVVKKKNYSKVFQHLKLVMWPFMGLQLNSFKIWEIRTTYLPSTIISHMSSLFGCCYSWTLCPGSHSKDVAWRPFVRHCVYRIFSHTCFICYFLFIISHSSLKRNIFGFLVLIKSDLIPYISCN